MNAYTCPFCNKVMSVGYSECSRFYINRNAAELDHPAIPQTEKDPTSLPSHTIKLLFYTCPDCHRTSILLSGVGESVKGIEIPVFPRSKAIKFPEYIPQQIRQDYEEACAIVNLSPKASATLARRCLQGMIRDFWNINKNNLNDAIKALNGIIPAAQWRVLNDLRQIGNIGAHMEKDVNLIVDIDPTEAEKLLKLVEHLLKNWYIERHEQELLYKDICDINLDLQNKRKLNIQSSD